MSEITLDRTPLSELVPLSDRCCGRCTHGRSVKDPGDGHEMIECRQGPPVPILVMATHPLTGKPVSQLMSRWPALVPSEVCDSFKVMDRSS